MCIRLYLNALSSVAMVIVTLAGPSTANAQTTEKQKAPAVFDPAALSETIEELNTSANVDLFDTPLKELLDMVTERHELKFKVEISEPRSVTIRATGKLGNVLVQLLATVKCEYAILPNGVIVVRESPRMPTDKHSKSGRP